MTTSALAAVAQAAAATVEESAGASVPVPSKATESDNTAAVAQAEAEGRKSGASAERERLAGVMSAEGITGNAARMSHALELAVNAPDMSADKIVSMTTTHVSGASDAPDGASLAGRQSDADPLGGSEGSADTTKAGIDISAIYQVHNGAKV